MLLKIFLFLSLLSRFNVYSQEIGKPCTVEKTNVPGTCADVNSCQDAIKTIRGGGEPTRCSFRGITEVVCCPNSEINENQRISGQKCAEYAEAVFAKISLIVPTAAGEAVTRKIDKCGHKTQPLIVGGEHAKEREFPHMALIGFGNKNTHWGCGSTLISNNHVLTAAHCSTKEPHGDAKHVRLGELDLKSTTERANPQDFSIVQFIPHPKYNAGINYEDIAIVKFDGPVRFNQYIRPACLPTIADGPELKAIATGWGSTDFSGPDSSHLLKVTVDKFSHQECSSLYPADDALPKGIIDETQICAGSHIDRKDTCQGDSGGPLQIFHHYRYCMYQIIGITSFGATCAIIGTPGIYTRVHPYVDWIEGTVWG